MREPEIAADRTCAACADDMHRIGLEVVSFTIKEVRDRNAPPALNLGRMLSLLSWTTREQREPRNMMELLLALTRSMRSRTFSTALTTMKDGGRWHGLMPAT